MLPFSATANNVNRGNLPFISDKYQRQVDYSNPIEVAQSRYPIASKFLPKKKNVAGQDIKLNNSDIPVLSQLEGLLNPFNVENTKSNAGINESLRVGEPFPVVKNKIKIDGKMKKLSSQEISKYQEMIGERNNDFINQIVNSESYQNLSEEEKADLINQYQKDIDTDVKSKLFGTKGLLEKKQLTADDLIKRKFGKINKINNLIRKSQITNY
jgi:hypothetical protein